MVLRAVSMDRHRDSAESVMPECIKGNVKNKINIRGLFLISYEHILSLYILNRI